MEGRVEVCSQGVWGTVSRFGWTSLTARVACSQLGYSDKSKAQATFMNECFYEFFQFCENSSNNNNTNNC